MSSFRHPTTTTARTNEPSNANVKPPKAPERPLVPYMRFSRKMWSKVRSDNPDAQLWDIGKVIGQMWRDTPESEKAIFQAEYEVEKNEYEQKMKQYQSSAPYQQYLAAKNRAKQSEKMSRNRTLDAGGVVIQPVDEDESHNELTARKVAHARFERNQRLLAELFNPQIVTDSRSIVGQSRIEMLRRQAQSLSSHQSKLEEELKKLDETFENKKRAIETGSEEFAETLKKVCEEEKPVMDQDKYIELVAEWEGKLAEAYVDYKKKQDEINAKIEADRAALTEKSTLFAMVAADENDMEKKSEEEKKSSTSANPSDREATPPALAGNKEKEGNTDKTDTESSNKAAEEESTPKEESGKDTHA